MMNGTVNSLAVLSMGVTNKASFWSERTSVRNVSVAFGEQVAAGNGGTHMVDVLEFHLDVA